MKIQANNLPTNITIESQNQQAEGQTANNTGVASQPNILEYGGYLNSFEAAIQGGNFSMEQIVGFDQERIASNIGVNETPEQTTDEIGDARDLDKSAGSSSGEGDSNQNSQITARAILKDYLNASGADPGSLPKAAQRLLDGDLGLVTDRERGDSILNHVGLGGGFVGSGIETSLFNSAESFDQGVSGKYGTGALNQGSELI